ncbi:transcriptional regulator [Paenibacillus aurantius]|uniref:Transcriptional regulator n=1 Tax=Paenibacillus aurantius TaxID=2918900 RepID=A0AA96RG99_9BACL|nr:metalloregulator ArsR/SmtB family transcription factor [Paenibacillus aurantius]WNQ09824.1 transcriptional regulator [Paenibacillus aurantius]
MKPNQDLSTRRVLLSLLKTRGSMTIQEMAQELGITEMAVRRHIQAMERDGWIAGTLVRQAVGRPAHRYALTAGADDLFPKNYHQLSLDLLGELEAEEGEELVRRLFEGRKRKLLAKYSEQMAGVSLAERVSRLAAIQDANGYMVAWREDGGRYTLEEYNCPISQVAQRYNQACTCELALFEKLLGARVERTECLTKGGRKCTYIIEREEA